MILKQEFCNWACLNVDPFVAIEYENLSAEKSSQGFDRLSFTRPSWAIGVAAQAHLHALGQSQVTLVGQRSVNQFGSVTLIKRNQTCFYSIHTVHTPYFLIQEWFLQETRPKLHIGYLCNVGGLRSIRDEVAIGSAAAISKVAISDGHW